MSVRRVSPRQRPAVIGLTMALVLSGWLSSLAAVGGGGSEAAADPAPPSTTSTTAPTTTTAPRSTTTSPPPTTTTTGVPPTSTTVTVPPTTAPTPSTSVPQAVAPPTSTTAPQGQGGPTGPVALAVVVSTGDGLTVKSTDGSERQPQVGESLQQGDQLGTTGAPNASSTPHPVSIRWLQGGMTDIYDATPRIFVKGHKSVPRVVSTITIDADPTPRLRVSQGFARFWFPPAEKGWYSFVASTDSVVVTTRGTDFTVGEDPASKASTVGVTQDSVAVAPVNPSLQAFQLSAGSQVQVTPDRVGPITPLADQAANSSRPSSRSTKTTLALWLVGLLLTVAVVSAAVGLASLWRDRRDGQPGQRGRRAGRGRRGAPPVPTLPPLPVPTPDLSFAHAGPPGHTQWVTLPAGVPGDDAEPALTPPHGAQSQSESARQPAAWEPTHRVPPEGMKARAIPVTAAGHVADLDPNLAVRMVEHRGNWANVLSADGWSGWVDARQLRPERDSA